MLIITRQATQTIHAGEVTILIQKIKGSRVKVGIDAPPHIKVLRGEITDGGTEASTDGTGTDARMEAREKTQ